MNMVQGTDIGKEKHKYKKMQYTRQTSMLQAEGFQQSKWFICCLTSYVKALLMHDMH